MACRRMRGAAAPCPVAALAADCPGVTAAVPAAPELRALNVAVAADVMQQLLRAPVRRDAGASGEPVMVSLWHFLIAPPAGASRERRSGNAQYLGALGAYRLGAAPCVPPGAEAPLIAYPARF